MNPIVYKALTDPKVYSGFDELLRSLPANDTTTTATSSSNTGSSLLANTLRLFSYGTYRDYCSAPPGTYMTLHESQLFKLKALTVASIVHGHCRRVWTTNYDYGNGKDDGTAHDMPSWGRIKDSTKNNCHPLNLQHVVATSTSHDPGHNPYRNRPSRKYSPNPTRLQKGGSCGIITYDLLQSELGMEHAHSDIPVDIATQETHVPVAASGTFAKEGSTTTVTVSVPGTVTATAAATASANLAVKRYDDDRPLEDLLIHCIYSNLLPSGTKLDAKNRCMVVQLSSSRQHSPSSTPMVTHPSSQHLLCRDVDLDRDLPEMIESLEAFYTQGKKIQNYLSQNKQAMAQSAMQHHEQWKAIDVELQSIQGKLRSGSKEEGHPIQIMEETPSPMSSSVSMSSTVMEWVQSSKSNSPRQRQVKRRDRKSVV